MGYYNVNEQLYNLLSKVVFNTEIISVADIKDDKTTKYPRLEESKFIITDNIKRTSSFVTAHYLDEYRPNQLKLERLMRESNKLMIDVLLEAIGGVRGGISLQSD